MTTTTDASDAGAGAYLAVLRRRLPLIVVPVLLGAVAGAVLGSTRPGSYQATVDVLVRAGATNPVGTSPTGRAGEVNTATETQVAASGSVAEVVARRLDGQVTSEELQSNVRVVAPDESQVLSFRYTAESPAEARRIAVAFADGYLEYRSGRIREDQATSRASLETRSDQLRVQLSAANAALAGAPVRSADAAAALAQQTELASQLAQVNSQLAEIDGLVVNPGNIITSTQPPVRSAGLQLPVLVVSGAAIGLLAGLLLALSRERTDDRVRVGAPGTAALAYPVLGRVAQTRVRGAAAGLPHLIADDYLMLAAKMTAMAPRHGLHVLLVTSGTLEERTTSVSAQLAAGLALDGTRVAILSLRDQANELDTLLGLGEVAESPESGSVPVEPGPAVTGEPAAAATTAQLSPHPTAVPHNPADRLVEYATASPGVRVSVRVTSAPIGPELISAVHPAPGLDVDASGLSDVPGVPAHGRGWNGVGAQGHHSSVGVPPPGYEHSPAGNGLAGHVAPHGIATPAPADDRPGGATATAGLHVRSVPFVPTLGAVTVGDRRLSTEALREVVRDLRSTWDWVVVDAPPIFGDGGALRAAPVADGVLIVADERRLHRGDIKTMEESLQWSGVDILGIVVTQARRGRARRAGRAS